MASRYWVGGNGTWDATTTHWSATSGGAGGATAPTSADDVIINSSSGSPTITLSGALACKSITTTGATCTFTSTGTLTVSGSITLSATTTWSATGLLTIGAISTITAGSTTFSCSISSAFSVTLGANLTLGTTNTFTFTAGTLTLSTFTLSAGLFSSTSGTRVIAFGTGNITTTGSGTAFNVVGTSLTYTGTPTVNISNNSSTATTITATSFSQTNAFNFNVTTGTYALTVTTASFFKSLNFIGFTGSWAPGTATATFYGSVTLVSGMTFTAGSGIWSWSASSGTSVLTSAGKTLGPNTIQLAGTGVFTIAQNTTIAACVYAGGIFDLTNGGAGNYTFTCTTFTATVTAGSRTLQFGTGNITTTGSGTAFNLTGGGSFSYTGTPTINISNNSATATTIAATLLDETCALNFNFTTGTYALTVTTNSFFKSLNFTGFAGTWSPSATNHTLYGSVTLVSGMTFTPGGGAWTFANTSGTAVITCAGKTVGPITLNASGGTLQLGDTFAQTAGQTFTYTAGTLDLNSKTNTFGTLTITAYPTFYINGTFRASNVTQTSGTVTIPSSQTLICLGTYTFTSGTFDVGTNNVVFSTGAFSSSNANTRVIAFGTSGAITTTGSGTTWTTATATNLTYTGTSKVNISNSGSVATTVSPSTTGGSTSNAFNFNFTSGTYNLTITTASISNVNTLDFTGFSGAWVGATNGTVLINGDLILSPTMTTSTGASIQASLAGFPSILTTNGVTLSASVTQGSVGGTIRIAGNTSILGSFTQNAGTLDLTNNSAGNYTLTVGNIFSTNSANVRSINFGTSGTIVLTGTGSAWNSNNTANFSYTGTGIIRFAGTTSQAFASGGLSLPNVQLQLNGTGPFSITGSNSFASISNVGQSMTLNLAASTTTTVGSFGLSGSAGNVVTLNSSTPGTQSTLSQASGTVAVMYMAIKDSNATGGATWTAAISDGNINNGNNSGWVFPSASSGNFFLMF